jgi:magnesium chelatase accessory protein
MIRRDWPKSAASQMVEAGGLRWHVQRMGADPSHHRPRMLLVHGTGASTHSWRALAPLLARRFEVLAPDLPGHAFSAPIPSGPASLSAMSRVLNHLLTALDFKPDIVVGHSAGAAILARMCLDGRIAPRLLVSLNGAFLPFEGLAGHLFPPIARLLFLNPLAPRLFAWSADRTTVTRLLRGTGSMIEPAGVDQYVHLFSDKEHVAGVLAMLANWSLEQLQRDLGKLKTPLALVVGAQDKAVPPESARQVLSRAPGARLERLRGLGHLAHEENPVLVADLIQKMSEEAGLLTPEAPPSP